MRATTLTFALANIATWNAIQAMENPICPKVPSFSSILMLSSFKRPGIRSAFTTGHFRASLNSIIGIW